MCAKTPKPKKVEEKPVQYLRNPFLDDVSIGNDTGRNSLRIDLGSQRTARPFEGSTTGASPKTDPMRGAVPTVPGLLIPSRRRGGGVTSFAAF